MTTKYVCDVCGREFGSPWVCRSHEASHFTGIERVKYDLIHDPEEDLCDYCDNSYYVYGCEQDCKFKGCSYNNNYIYFKPVEPFCNKRKHGGY
jgi:hypothetical protein